jgi:mannose-6-phosphate isomerase-like protein (cupin superfamily)
MGSAQEGSEHVTRLVGPDDGKSVHLGSIDARFMVYSGESGGGFALVEHPIPPRHLAAPLHRHSREDEYSYVIEGRLGALLGDDVVYAEVGELAFKPRDQWHTFWNAGDTPCRILEIISPGGFEHYFDEIADADGPARAAIAARYGLEVDIAGVAQLCEKYELRFPPLIP